MSDIIPQTPRTAIRRRPERGRYDRELVHRVLDEALVCHVGFVQDGEPRIIPTAITRIGEHVYLHGSHGNRMLSALASGALACIEVTLVDAIVAGRSGFGCSMDYRSVVIYGVGEIVADADKEAVMDAVVQDLIPGHQVRRLKQKELDATLVLRFALEEVSAKVRDLGVIDMDGDYELDLWAGTIPLRLQAGAPVDDPKLKPGIAAPEAMKNYGR
ncbi:MAG: pyridoxamine 5'-phosphate oxidase family protein [Alphaproteobacteria bacterium]|nr:pyridoxamine 5'-phosphate oxidase family protein [Alphaproteobacteria bacterium]MBU0796912.1 pyridoxamine 5'-phosphate oxidase family protein [Alphaproteobacteria bacterium]MBU0886444.1 pyridoxamine 5'-phosphate oxidase family protein [Alphaproteobacteria bacterium]MBU1812333.1 pyridoxamine 5'-phosphate oxidase family protein [Alphaproteobacteria bacterium]